MQKTSIDFFVVVIFGNAKYYLKNFLITILASHLQIFFPNQFPKQLTGDGGLPGIVSKRNYKKLLFIMQFLFTVVSILNR
jgi:hypothetical protein